MGLFKRLGSDLASKNQVDSASDQPKSPDKITMNHLLNIEVMDDKEAIFR